MIIQNTPKFRVSVSPKKNDLIKREDKINEMIVVQNEVTPPKVDLVCEPRVETWL